MTNSDDGAIPKYMQGAENGANSTWQNLYMNTIPQQDDRYLQTEQNQFREPSSPKAMALTNSSQSGVTQKGPGDGSAKNLSHLKQQLGNTSMQSSNGGKDFLNTDNSAGQAYGNEMQNNSSVAHSEFNIQQSPSLTIGSLNSDKVKSSPLQALGFGLRNNQQPVSNIAS